MYSFYLLFNGTKLFTATHISSHRIVTSILKLKISSYQNAAYATVQDIFLLLFLFSWVRKTKQPQTYSLNIILNKYNPVSFSQFQHFSLPFVFFYYYLSITYCLPHQHERARYCLALNEVEILFRHQKSGYVRADRLFYLHISHRNTWNP